MTSQQKISRRTIAKGAAWSVPVVAVAAAAPASAASTPACPGASCPKPVLSAVTLSTGVFAANTNTADLNITAGTEVANFLTPECSGGGLLQASLVTVGDATLTMKETATGKTTAYTGTTGVSAGATAASAAFAMATIGASFPSVNFPDGDLLSGLTNAPVVPQSLCISYTVVLDVLGSTPGTTVTCPGQVCFGFNLLTGSLYSVNQGVVPNTVSYLTSGLLLP
ncbi:MAG TPA: hypothetical protein VG502_01230 [Flexivirga sp.]|uniref:hypothetical protein n=1 Tax=Flexivirga sp. TaxID=1962927 RepID=UPI002C10D35B|nr:hypothetical protein [Flexivirga sp.]HWC20896.1 hypothetical protein [Flexivirga sp.]